MLSVIIAARQEIYLEKTIRNVLENAEGEIEIIVLLDGYIPDPQIVIGDNRVIFYHYPESIGQRKCINNGVALAKGEFILKLDAHCAVDKGFDVKLAADYQEGWTVIPRMYNLDIHTWTPKLRKRTDYMYISSPQENKPFRASYYTGKEYWRWHKRTELIDDTMCCMGPGWFMSKETFLKQGGCDENHEGGWGQQGIEVSLKAWLSGGALKVNKKTWFAHWFRGDVGFPYPISGHTIERVRKYSRDLWLNNKWDKQVRTLDWLVKKFAPPTWNRPKISVIIPSYKDPCLHKTIQSILDTFETEFEIIPVCDGYKPTTIVDDPRVKPIYLDKNVGMREAINKGIHASTGEYIMRADEHIMFAQGFDKTILKTIKDNWIVDAKRYFLDVEKWEVMNIPPIEYEKLLVIEKPNGIRKFGSVRSPGWTKDRKDEMIGEKMALQGSCWVMKRSWWDKVIKRLESEGYGTHYQDTTEMLFKTWKAGGKLMLNKNTWYAHKHRSFNRTHQYPTAKAIPEWKFALDKHLPEYQQIKERFGI